MYIVEMLDVSIGKNRYLDSFTNSFNVLPARNACHRAFLKYIFLAQLNKYVGVLTDSNKDLNDEFFQLASIFEMIQIHSSDSKDIGNTLSLSV